MSNSAIRTPAADVARLWAPWRGEFLTKEKPRRCIFCAVHRSAEDERHHVVSRGAEVFALLNRYPYNNGHLLIAPYRHVGTLASLNASEWTEILRMCQRLTARLTRALHPHGFNLGVNLGRAAGAGLPGHLHVHVVPRWNGDTNFMPLLANTKVLSQSLEELYALLAA